MCRKNWYTVGGGLAAVAVLAGGFAIAYAQQPSPVDRGKNSIETGTKTVFGQQSPNPFAQPRLDVGKGRIERPTEAVLAKALANAASREAADKAFVNPKVPPGKVNWHADFAAACRASAKTGRPVLLFQMMGQLDNKFC